MMVMPNQPRAYHGAKASKLPCLRKVGVFRCNVCSRLHCDFRGNFGLPGVSHLDPAWAI